jgi:cell division protein FtsB
MRLDEKVLVGWAVSVFVSIGLLLGFTAIRLQRIENQADQTLARMQDNQAKMIRLKEETAHLHEDLNTWADSLDGGSP